MPSKERLNKIQKLYSVAQSEDSLRQNTSIIESQALAAMGYGPKFDYSAVLSHKLFIIHKNDNMLVYNDSKIQEMQQAKGLTLPFHRIASSTKPIISFLAYILEDKAVATPDQHPLKMDNTISDYLNQDELKELFPNFSDNSSALKELSTVTIYQLLTHTSGLKCFGSDNPNLNEQLYESKNQPLTLHEQLSLTPATLKKTGEFHYANTNYQLMDIIFKKITGQQTYQLLHEHIMQPNTIIAAYRDETGALKLLGQNNIEDFDTNLAEPVLYVDNNGQLVEDNRQVAWGWGGLYIQADQQALLMKHICNSTDSNGVKLTDKMSKQIFDGEYGAGMEFQKGYIGHDGGTLGAFTSMCQIKGLVIVSQVLTISDKPNKVKIVGQPRPDIVQEIKEICAGDLSPNMLRKAATQINEKNFNNAPALEVEISSSNQQGNQQSHQLN